MSITLRIILIAGSILSFILCVVRIKQSKLKVTNTVVWMFGSILLILMTIFTDAVTWVAHQLGFIAPVNFGFFVVISFLLVQVFIDNIRINKLNEKIKDLDHYMALKEYNKKEEESDK